MKPKIISFGLAFFLLVFNSVMVLKAGKAEAQQQVMLKASSEEKIQPRCSEKALPDITVKEVGWTPGSTDNWKVGDNKPVYVDLRNIGQCETGSFKVKLSVFEQDLLHDSRKKHAVGVKEVESLMPYKTRAYEGSSTTIQFNYRIPYRYAAYRFSAKADFDNAVAEFDEFNNFKDSFDYQIDTR